MRDNSIDDPQVSGAIQQLNQKEKIRKKNSYSISRFYSAYEMYL